MDLKHWGSCSPRYEAIFSNNEARQSALMVWIKKPELLLKKISGTLCLELGCHNIECISNLLKNIKELNFSTKTQYFDFKTKILSVANNLLCKGFTEICNATNVGNATLLRFLCPKDNLFSFDMLEIIILDLHNNAVAFLKPLKNNDKFLSVLPESYCIKFSQNYVQFYAEKAGDSESLNWLSSKLLPNILKWSKFIPREDSINSLSLLPIDEYCFLYNNLKKKYSNFIKEIWVEKTNPDKFIFEDIAIAAYLILLWKTPQQFIDLGCGNGLLVFLLTSENHNGIGIDVRPRKIWKLYPENTKLEVRTLLPSEESLFPNADWLIGNHSDELTPWIPVIAARSSYKCNFFLLPCCAYNFNGKKYSRSNSGESVYQNYIAYIQNMSLDFGFKIKKDKLKIPSTKRTCIISDGRVYKEEEMSLYKKNILKYLISNNDVEDSQIIKNSNSLCWIEDFKPRSDVEEVRNCTKIGSTIVEEILKITTTKLLQHDRDSPNNEIEWNRGRPTSLSDIASSIPKSLLENLKNEHGGLQTMLRNNSFIFKIENGIVQFRKPQIRCKDSVPSWKQKLCWFYYNHPNSCPLRNDKCSFIH